MRCPRCRGRLFSEFDRATGSEQCCWCCGWRSTPADALPLTN